jgi:hypothetical protein
VSTAPWGTDTPALLAAGALTHVSQLTVTTPDGDVVALPVTGGALTYDDARSPRVDFRADVHLDPLDVALLSRIDPRRPCRVLVELGYARPDGLVDRHPVTDLGLRSRSRTRPGDEMTLTARSDEALLLDNAPSASLTVSTATTALGIKAVILTVLPSADVTIDVTDTGPAVAIAAQPDCDKWDTISDLADQIVAAVYDDGTGAWFVTDRVNAYTTPAVILEDGAGGTIVNVREDNDRESDWYNRVKLVHEWRDSSDVDHRVMSVADATGPYAPVTGNVRVLEVDRETPTTQLKCNAAAATLASRAVTRGRVLNVSAPSTYWLRPGDTVEVRETGRDPEAHLVSSVTFDLRSGLMDVTTRQPD